MWFDAMNFADLKVVNVAINALPYVAGVDPLWQPIDADADGGTCSNYAVAKLRALKALGWPIESLRVATCWVTRERNPKTDYHAVLLVDYDGATWEMSNGIDHPNEIELTRWDYDLVQNRVTRKWEYYKAPGVA